MDLVPLDIATVAGLIRLGLADLPDTCPDYFAEWPEDSDAPPNSRKINPQRSKARSNTSSARSELCDASARSCEKRHQTLVATP
jgi:hypothetical protein